MLFFSDTGIGDNFTSQLRSQGYLYSAGKNTGDPFSAYPPDKRRRISTENEIALQQERVDFLYGTSSHPKITNI